MYKPLPDSVTIKESPISGLGLLELYTIPEKKVKMDTFAPLWAVSVIILKIPIVSNF